MCRPQCAQGPVCPDAVSSTSSDLPSKRLPRRRSPRNRYIASVLITRFISPANSPMGTDRWQRFARSLTCSISWKKQSPKWRLPVANPNQLLERKINTQVHCNPDDSNATLMSTKTIGTCHQIPHRALACTWNHEFFRSSHTLKGAIALSRQRMDEATKISRAKS